MDARLDIWQKLSDEWSVPEIDRVVTEIGLEDLDSYVEQILAGKIRGRTVVRVTQ